MNRKIFLGVIISFVVVLLAFALFFVFKGEKSGELIEPSEKVQEELQNSDSYIYESTSENETSTSTAFSTINNAANSGIVNADEYFMGVTTSNIFNEELQIYLNTQTEIHNNKIILTAEKIGNKYISGKAESKCAFRYGEFSFRVNILKGKGYFPAIWLMPQNGDSLPETDIFEMVGKDPNNVHGVVHFIKNGFQDKHNFITKINSNETESIIIDFKWLPNKMSWTINGKTENVLKEDVPQVPVYMILNLAVGGKWPGAPDGKTAFPAQFNVEILKFNPTEIYSRDS